MQLQRARTTLEHLDIAPLILTFEAFPFAVEYVAETGLYWPLMVDVDRELYRAYAMHRARWRDLWGFATMRVYAREALEGRIPSSKAVMCSSIRTGSSGIFMLVWGLLIVRPWITYLPYDKGDTDPKRGDGEWLCV